MTEKHISVLAVEWLKFLEGRVIHTYVDGTLGAGGHASLVLSAHPEIQNMIGIDQDAEALALAKQRLLPWVDKVSFCHANFAEIDEVFSGRDIDQVDAILLDLGVSSMQLDQGERGFSFQHTGPLDMRMNRECAISAETIVNTWPEEELGRIFREYGEERSWRRAAKQIVKERGKKALKTTKDLVDVLGPVLKKGKKNIHPATKIFQALRICVNGELEVLRDFLPKALARLKSGGILGVISFHSLEDRIVKNFLRHEASHKQDTSGLAGLFLEKLPTVDLLTRKPIVASEDEIESNPRSRSAKLRVAEKK